MSNLSCFMLCLVLLAGVSDGKKSSWLMALLSKSSNENVSNDLKHSSHAFSVLTNQVYQDDNDKENMSFYQKLIGGSKVDKYQEGSGIINHLVDAKNMVADGIAIEANATIEATTDSEGIEMIKCGMNTVLETILRGILEGLLPSVERVRRDADGDKRTYLDMFVSLVGAMMGRLRCNHLVALQDGQVASRKIALGAAHRHGHGAVMTKLVEHQVTDMWLMNKCNSFPLLLFLMALSFTSSSAHSAPDGDIGSVLDGDIGKSRQSRALATSSFNPYQLYKRLTTAPTLQGFFLNMAGTAFRVVGWIFVTVTWTLSGLSEDYDLDSAIDYDYVNRFVTHYTDPQQAGIRIVINFGGQIFGAIILAALASIGSITDDLLSRKKRDMDQEEIEGRAFNYDKNFEAKDRMDSNCDGTCSLLYNVYFIVDRIFSYPFAIIMLSENLVFLAGKTIFWTILGLLPDPDEIVDSLEAF